MITLHMYTLELVLIQLEMFNVFPASFMLARKRAGVVSSLTLIKCEIAGNVR